MRAFFTVLLIFYAVSDARAETLTIFYHERHPYFINTPEGPTGITAERIEGLFEMAQMAFEWKEMPPKRQILFIENNENAACAAGWFKNPTREKFAQFVGPIYQDLPSALLTRQDFAKNFKNQSIQQIMASSKAVILLKDSYSYGSILDNLLKKSELDRLVTSADDLKMARMIGLYRADFMFVSEEEGLHFLQKHKFSELGLVLVRPSGMPKGNNRYLMCSQKVSEDVIDHLNSVTAR